MWPLWVWHDHHDHDDHKSVWNCQLLKLFEFSPRLYLSNRFSLLNSHFSKFVWIFRCHCVKDRKGDYTFPFPGRLELFWLPDRGALPRWAARGRSLRTFDAEILPSPEVTILILLMISGRCWWRQCLILWRIIAIFLELNLFGNLLIVKKSS